MNNEFAEEASPNQKRLNDRSNELKNKRICRFCLTQKEPLSNIYSRENRLKTAVPLPLQIMASVSIEIFTNDGLPSTICDACRQLMDHCYRFKQVCKKADTLLKQFPLTGTWPPSLERPRMTTTLFKVPQRENTVLAGTPPKMAPIPKRPAALAAESPQKFNASDALKRIVKEEVTVQRISPTMKVLNKTSPKILNKNVLRREPVLSDPIITTDDNGQVKIVTELIENFETVEEPDALIKNATPVETNVFPCQHCERSFPLRQLLEIHMNNHTRERCFQCNICEKRFFSKYDLGKHVLIHTGEKPFECIICLKRFSRSTLLRRHEKVHTDIPKYLCIFCERPFLSKSELDKHTENHTKSRPFTCTICNKRFAFKQGLERHEVVHSKVQPYPCEYCEISFSTPSKLARHLTAHAGRRPFPCKLCSKSYLLSHHLTRHLRSHSNGIGTYKCGECGDEFQTRDDLIYHSAVHATQNLICPLCKEKFNDLDAITEHIKSHTIGEQYACEYCDLIFTTDNKLSTHRKADHFEEHQAYIDADQKLANTLKQEVDNDDSSSDEEIVNDDEDIEDDGDGDDLKQIDNNENKSNKAGNDANTDKNNRKIEMDKKPIKNVGREESVVTVKMEKRDGQTTVRRSPIVKGVPGRTTTPVKVEQKERTPSPEVQRPKRSNKVKDYAELIKGKMGGVDDEEEEEEDFDSVDDEDYIVEEVDDGEEDEVPPPKRSRYSVNVSATSTQNTSSSSGTGRQHTVQQANSIERGQRIVKVESKTQRSSERVSSSPRVIKSSEITELIKKSQQSSKGTATSTSTSATAAAAAAVTLPSTAPLPSSSSSSSSSSAAAAATASAVPSSSSPSSLVEKIKKQDAERRQAMQDVLKNLPKGVTVIKKESKPCVEAAPPLPGPSKKPLPDIAKKARSANHVNAMCESQSKLVEMKIGDRLVRVKKITMTKAEVAVMAKEGKIEVKDGAMILKQMKSGKRAVASTSGVTSVSGVAVNASTAATAAAATSSGK